MKKDTNLKKRLGNDNHFKVPDNYFENLVPNIMNQLPEQEVQEVPHIRLWDRVKPWLYMAAMFCGLLFTIRAVVKNNLGVNGEATIEDEQFSELPDEYIDPVLDNIMIDDYTLYVYLADMEADIY